VRYTVEGGAGDDLLPVSGIVTIADGESTATITISAIQDSTPEVRPWSNISQSKLDS